MDRRPESPRTTRRAFLKAGAVAALYPAAAWPHGAARDAPRRRPHHEAQGPLVNDVHSRLNPTRVARIERPDSTAALQALVRTAARRGDAVSVAGGRHAMGGQQFGTSTTLVDSRGLSRVLSFDAEAGIVEVEAGIQWPELVAWLEREQRGVDGAWGIVQKQTGADRLSLGGALAANVHSRGLTLRPIVQDVESFVLIGPDGEARTCSRSENAELFALAIGGYGLFGPVASVRLRLARRHKVERVVGLAEVDDVMEAFDERIADGFEYGDFQFATAAGDGRFLREGVLSCYRPVADDTPVPATRAAMSPDAWSRLALLAHADPVQAYEEYARYYLGTSGQVYWSDTQQMSYYDDGYHAAVSQGLGETPAGSEMITEIYVPREALADFMGAARERLRGGTVPLIYGTVRLIEQDDESYLAWARRPWACIIFNLHVEHTEAGTRRAAGTFRGLIDDGLRHGGSYYLTYHRWARRDQVEAAHPRLAGFLERKLRHDPEERFQSDWYRHYREMFRRG